MQIALFILCGCACVAFGESTYVGKQFIIIICPIIVADCRIETIQFSIQYLSHTVIAHSTFIHLVILFIHSIILKSNPYIYFDWQAHKEQKHIFCVYLDSILKTTFRYPYKYLSSRRVENVGSHFHNSVHLPRFCPCERVPYQNGTLWEHQHFSSSPGRIFSPKFINLSAFGKY